VSDESVPVSYVECGLYTTRVAMFIASSKDNVSKQSASANYT